MRNLTKRPIFALRGAGFNTIALLFLVAVLLPVGPLKSQVLIGDPDEYFMRPHLFPGKFPGARNVSIPADLEARVRAQNEAGHLIFESGGTATSIAGE